MRTMDVYCNLIEHEQMKKGDDEISIRTFVDAIIFLQTRN